MIASLGKSKKIVVYIVHGVKDYTGEVDIDLREGSPNEPPYEDNATTFKTGPSNVNVEDTNQGINETQHDENDIYSPIFKKNEASDDDEHDDEATDEGLGDEHEANEEAKIDDNERLVDVDVENEDEDSKF
ncbi:uncharacterized protein A4U43_C03F18990 [Asparagus officinalis]|uniref:Uncharacterized protein n=1 Tax=Asparagus officinalis TaxID=4686 RepID=A0A5P1FFJ9_ASPOF|nr:uncharacterized protein A4U43_C03F18990 [Asparagus officinalis]